MKTFQELEQLAAAKHPYTNVPYANDRQDELRKAYIEAYQDAQAEFYAEDDCNILEEANKLVYGNRQADYGSVRANFNNIARGWSVIAKTDIDAEQVGLMMVWVKIARQLHKPKRDNLVDGAGYFATIEKMQKETDETHK